MNQEQIAKDDALHNIVRLHIKLMENDIICQTKCDLDRVCRLCGNDTKKTCCYIVRGCYHVFHRLCLTNYIAKNSSESIQCPLPECDNYIIQNLSLNGL